MSVTMYRVAPGDQVYRILRSHFGDSYFIENQDELVEQVRANNPHIRNIDTVFPGQCIALGGAPGAGTATPEIPSTVVGEVPGLARTLSSGGSIVSDAWSEVTGEKIAKGVGGSYVSYVKKTAKEAAEGFSNVTGNYASKAAGDITKGAYDGRRIKLMANYDKSLGALKPLHRPMASSRAVLHIRPNADIPTASLQKEVATISRYFKTASRGVVILRVVSVAETAMKVAASDSGSAQVNELVGTGAGIVGGIASAAAGGFIFGAMIASPVGWVAIGGIMLAGAVGVGGSVMSEELARRVSQGLLYDEDGKAIYKDKLLSPGFALP